MPATEELCRELLTRVHHCRQANTSNCLTETNDYMRTCNDQFYNSFTNLTGQIRACFRRVAAIIKGNITAISQDYHFFEVSQWCERFIAAAALAITMKIVLAMHPTHTHDHMAVMQHLYKHVDNIQNTHVANSTQKMSGMRGQTALLEMIVLDRSNFKYPCPSWNGPGSEKTHSIFGLTSVPNNFEPLPWFKQNFEGTEQSEFRNIFDQVTSDSSVSNAPIVRQLLGHLGEGGYGTVSSVNVSHGIDPPGVYAQKVNKFTKRSETTETASYVKKNGLPVGYVREIILMRLEASANVIGSMNVVRCLGVSYKLWPDLELTLFMNRYSMDLQTFVTRKRLIPDKLPKYIKDLVSGLHYMKHVMGTVHRDIKPENILVDMQNENNYVLKFSDFGVARRALPIPTTADYAQTLTNGVQYIHGTGVKINFSYTPAENLLHSMQEVALDSRHVTQSFAGDVWSVACVIYFMYSGHAWFAYTRTDDYETECSMLLDQIYAQLGSPDNPCVLYNASYKGKRFNATFTMSSDMPQALRQLLLDMTKATNYDPRTRITPEMILQKFNFNGREVITRPQQAPSLGRLQPAQTRAAARRLAAAPYTKHQPTR